MVSSGGKNCCSCGMNSLPSLSLLGFSCCFLVWERGGGGGGGGGEALSELPLSPTSPSSTTDNGVLLHTNAHTAAHFCFYLLQYMRFFPLNFFPHHNDTSSIDTTDLS